MHNGIDDAGPLVFPAPHKGWGERQLCCIAISAIDGVICPSMTERGVPIEEFISANIKFVVDVTVELGDRIERGLPVEIRRGL